MSNFHIRWYMTFVFCFEQCLLKIGDIKIKKLIVVITPHFGAKHHSERIMQINRRRPKYAYLIIKLCKEVRK